MKQMKEKLVKNHYKGFDRKVKVLSISSAIVMCAAICTFLPLSVSLERSVEQAKTQEVQNDFNKNNEQIIIPKE